MDTLEQVAAERFQFGRSQVSAQEILGWSAVQLIYSKLPTVPLAQLAVGIRECLRFLYLGAYSPKSIFIPGNELVDKIWHTLVLETKLYRKVCHSIRPGSFLHHSSMSYHDYAELKSAQELHEEQISWLVSYVANFGPLDQKALNILPIAKSLADRLEVNLAQLNAFAIDLRKAADAQTITTDHFDFDSYVEKVVLATSAQLDSDPVLVGDRIREIMAGLSFSSRENEVVLPTLSQLELLFSSSTALAFTLSQHVSAVDRLSLLEEWKNGNQDQWESIKRGRYLCGLATTNLGKPGGAGVQAIENERGFLLNGSAPWVCGYGIFDGVVLGFETVDSYVFALLDFPHPLHPDSLENVQVRPHNLSSLNGTATCSISFQDTLVNLGRVISRRDKNIVGRPRTTKGYLIPELGMAVGAIREIEKTIEDSEHPRLVPIRQSVGLLKNRLLNIRKLRDADEPVEKLITLRDELIHDANRLLILALGARSLEKGSLASRAQLEFMLMDTVVQAPEVFAEKARLIAVDKHGMV